jgi:hypothetical protein
MFRQVIIKVAFFESVIYYFLKGEQKQAGLKDQPGFDLRNKLSKIFTPLLPLEPHLDRISQSALDLLGT